MTDAPPAAGRPTERQRCGITPTRTRAMRRAPRPSSRPPRTPATCCPTPKRAPHWTRCSGAQPRLPQCASVHLAGPPACLQSGDADHLTRHAFGVSRARCARHGRASGCCRIPASHMRLMCRARAAREAKFAGQDEKRRRMRETLERNEKAAATGRSEEAEARTRLQVGACRPYTT